MIREPLVTQPDTSIADAVTALYQAKDNYIVVVDEQVPVGVVCDRTLITALATQLDLTKTAVKSVMAPLPTLPLGQAEEVSTLTQLMKTEGSACVAIVDKASHLQGLVTSDTLVQQSPTNSPPDDVAKLQKRIKELEHQVSDRQLLAAKLRSSEGKIRAVFEAMKDLVFVCDLDGGEISNIEVAPTNSSEGCEPDTELISHTIDELWQDPEQQWSHIIQQAIETQQTVNFDYQLMIEGQPAWFTASISPLLDNSVVWVARNLTEQKDSVVWVARNITERKHFEHELQQLNQELERSNQELEQFAYVASHDLQEPLRMVISFTQLLSQNYAGQLDEQADQIIGFAVDGATRMQQLIQDLLSYSRVGTQAKVLETVDCNQILEGAIANLQLSIQESGATLNRTDLPTLTANPRQLTQLFQNLVGNALKYRGEAAPIVEIGCQPQQNHYLFWVKDNGIGIEPKHADRVFMVFQRLHTRQKYAGTGIGLAICKKIVEQQGGNIWVESELNQGSTFFFTLPESPSA
ncbi:ATP-binding protein [Acaryochloris sp. IP29b_bin.148]|uniref:ATP-binding protein n=1 Tax=Acaryochloris sp. IP29b_bin.148 TaxID=2969218 RepID=UPI0026392B99|nr:ATP-binding protein [Acaryochloris sp. IP29b_bin.148]